MENQPSPAPQGGTGLILAAGAGVVITKFIRKKLKDRKEKSPAPTQQGRQPSVVGQRSAAQPPTAADADAMYNEGIRLNTQGRISEAEQRWRKAAAARHPEAMADLGAMLYEQGKKSEAEQWSRKAAAAGNVCAMNNLASCLYEQGKKSEAEPWLRKAAAAGDADVMYNLALLLSEQDKKDETEQWLRKAAAAGHVDAMKSLAVLLRNEGNKSEAKEWSRKAKAARPRVHDEGRGVHQKWEIKRRFYRSGGNPNALRLAQWAADAAEHAPQFGGPGNH